MALTEPHSVHPAQSIFEIQFVLCLCMQDLLLFLTCGILNILNSCRSCRTTRWHPRFPSHTPAGLLKIHHISHCARVFFYLLGIHFMDGCIREAVVMEETHLLVEQAVDDMSPRVLPLHQTHQLAVQRGAQVHGPVIAVQRHLTSRRWNITFRNSEYAESMSHAFICPPACHAH